MSLMPSTRASRWRATASLPSPSPSHQDRPQGKVFMMSPAKGQTQPMRVAGRHCHHHRLLLFFSSSVIRCSDDWGLDACCHQQPDAARRQEEGREQQDKDDCNNQRGDDSVDDRRTPSAPHNNKSLVRVGGRGGFKEEVEDSCGRLTDKAAVAPSMSKRKRS